MPIIVNVDIMLAKRKMSSGELAEKVGITPANLSILKSSWIVAIFAKSCIFLFSFLVVEDSIRMGLL